MSFWAGFHDGMPRGVQRLSAPTLGPVIRHWRESTLHLLTPSLHLGMSERQVAQLSTHYNGLITQRVGRRALSLRPSLHSGMPERKVRILSAPMTSERTTVPLLLTSRFTLSTTSRKTSFFLNLRAHHAISRLCTAVFHTPEV